ncbi:MAG: aldo/keto reductase [Thermoplasmata archaeon]|jgi:myo-inositol catabolism protein IolS|nr:aldo/keto reductase [Thermoplasmata archaeon]
MTARTRKAPTRAPKAAPHRPASAPPEIATLPLAGGRKAHPALGLGLWAQGRWTPADEARTKATIGRGYEQGFRWFDTAEVYGGGRSERILGDVLARAAGGAPDVFITTKVSWEHLRPAQVRASLINSLERLGRTSVDLYLIHAPDAKVPLSDTIPALESLWKEGRVGAIGVSNFGVEELEEATRHLSEARIVVNQVRYNLFDRDEATPVQEYCRAHQILIEAYSPLARGLLHGRYLDAEKPTAEFKRFVQRQSETDLLPDLLRRARALRTLADEAGVPLASIALHWLARNGAAPIVGATRPEQVDGNLAAWRVRPDDSVLDRADAIARGDRA